MTNRDIFIQIKNDLKLSTLDLSMALDISLSSVRRRLTGNIPTTKKDVLAIKYLTKLTNLELEDLICGDIDYA